MYQNNIYTKAISKIFITLAINIIFIAPLNAQFFFPIGISDSTITQTNDPVGKPYGGGSGYFPIITAVECNIIIENNNFNSFKTILENANYGDRIYINDNLEIEIPAEGTLTIPDGVTLASGRGKNGSLGALLYLDEIRQYVDYQWYHYITAGNDVKITGIRLRGPDGSTSLDNAGYCPGGILQKNGQNLVIHNCEIYNWYWMAINLQNSTGANIHHNYIHNNQKMGAGYGIGNGWNSSSEIRYNIFNYNRHSIAGNGWTDGTSLVLPSYTAEYNLVLPCANGHRFDMHGFVDECKHHKITLCDDCNYWEPCNIAGDVMEIHNNTFIAIPGVPNRYMIYIRGIPNTGAHITNNVFNTYDRAVNQFLRYYTRETCDTCAPCDDPINAILNMDGEPYTWNPEWCFYWGDFDVSSNHMIVNSNNYTADIHIRRINWGGNAEGYVTVAPEIRFSNSSTFEFGDFNGDGRTDILNQGYISYSGLTEWELYSENYTINPNHLIDFNGDGLEDAMQIVHPTTLWPDGCY